MQTKECCSQVFFMRVLYQSLEWMSSLKPANVVDGQADG